MGKKKITTIHIDEAILNKAKKEIDNISNFVEECLKAYLGLDDTKFNISSIDNELETMKQANLNIHLLSGKDEIEKSNQKISDQEINDAWIKIWREYRINENCNYNDANKLSELVDYTSDEIMDMMDCLLMNCNRKQLLKCETFKGAELQYKSFIIE